MASEVASIQDTASDGAAEQFLSGGGETGTLIRAYDWSSTPLGPPASWPNSLKTAVSLMLGAGQPVYIAWGPGCISLYNDGYLSIVGTKHPGIGKPFEQLWAEIWDQFRPIVEKTLAGHAQYFVDMPIALAGRKGVPVGYFTFSYTPLRDDDGTIAGFYCAATETTERVLAEERLRQAEVQLRQQVDQLNALYDSAPIGLGFFDRNYRYLRVNEELALINGDPPGSAGPCPDGGAHHRPHLRQRRIRPQLGGKRRNAAAAGHPSPLADRVLPGQGSERLGRSGRCMGDRDFRTQSG